MDIKNYSRPVNYYETDKMNIVHHSNYIRYFEEARYFWLEQIGWSFKKIEDAGLMSPVVDAYAKYHASLRYGDVFSIKTKLVQFNGVKFKFEYEVYNQENVLCSTGFSTHCFSNQELRPISVKRSHKEMYERLLNLVEE